MPKITPVEEWQSAIKKHIDKLTTDEERYHFAHAVIYDTALWTGYTTYETIGLLEFVKAELLESFRMPPDCDGDCDNCDKNEE